MLYFFLLYIKQIMTRSKLEIKLTACEDYPVRSCVWSKTRFKYWHISRCSHKKNCKYWFFTAQWYIWWSVWIVFIVFVTKSWRRRRSLVTEVYDLQNVLGAIFLNAILEVNETNWNGSVRLSKLEDERPFFFGQLCFS